MAVKRATPAELRKGLESARAYADAGISFICLPVLDDKDRQGLILESLRRLGVIEAEADENGEG